MGLIYNSPNEAAAAAANYQSRAESAISSARNAASAAVQSANANQGVIANYNATGIANAQDVQERVRENSDRVNGVLAQSQAAAAGMTPYIGQVGDAATRVTQTAASLTPYADQLSAYAQQLAASGDALRTNGAGWLTNAQDLMNLNPNAGGIIGKTVKNINAYDPNELVSLAAADVQQSGDNARAQMMRNISRTGGSTTSGNALAAQADLARSLAAALAGAKTRTRISGIKEQTAVLRSALADAMQLQATGNATIQQGNAATQGAANATASAAGVVANKGQLEASAGNLAASAAQLQGSLANVYNGIAQIYGNNSSQEIAAGGLVNSAISNAASSTNTAASIRQSAYSTAAGVENNAVNYFNTQASEAGSLATYLDSIQSGETSTYERNKAQDENGYYNGNAHTFSNDALSQVGSVSYNPGGSIQSNGGGRALYEYEKR